MRVDAKAEGDHIAIGGRLPVRGQDGAIDTMASPWFSLRLTEETPLWAYVRGAPARVVSTLEFLATA
eukprot:6377263-Lingulodinium_polyedra.AAC.1